MIEIDRAAFHAYLATQAASGRVFRPVGEPCPLAVFIGQPIYYDEGPPWANAFMQRIDEEVYFANEHLNPCPAATALAVLDSIGE